MIEKTIAEIVAEALKLFKEKYLTPLSEKVDAIEPFDPSQLQNDIAAVKELIPETPEQFDPSALEEKIKSVEESIPEPFDPSNLEEKIADIKPFDPSALEEKIKSVEEAIPTPYDDTKVRKDIDKHYQELSEAIEETSTELEEKIKSVEEAIPEQFDPSALEEKIKSVEEAIPEQFDPTQLEEKIKDLKEDHAKSLQEHIDAVKEVFEKKITALEKELATPIKVEIPTAKQYSGEPATKGTFILHDNALYLNLLDGNDSEPSELNKSYKQIIKAPKAPVHKGVYDPKAKDYEFNDMVMWENSTWIKTNHPDTAIPSEGWKLVAKAVKGRKGEKGEPGDVTIVQNDEILQELHDEITILKATIKGLENATD